jgi:Xaa-Pro aminopeptidase
MDKKRIMALRKRMAENDLQAFLVSSKPNRFYLSGFTGTYGLVLIDHDNQYIIADGRYFEQLKTQSPEFTVVDNKMRMTETLKNFCREKHYQRVGIESDEMNVTEYLALANSGIKLQPTKNWVESNRMIKDQEELLKIQTAGQIADETFNYILTYIRPGMTERHVANEIDRFGIAHGADAPAFETIVAAGERSALPHGHASNRVINKDEMIILDFGFLADHYYSDITRTIVLGQVSNELRHIYELTLHAQQEAIAACEAGRSLKDIDGIARDIISKSGYGRNFLHGTGHGLGLTVHEYPLLNQDSTEILQPHMTFTVEPGIYLADQGGVRIEDDVWVNDAGEPVILTHAPKQWTQI